MAKRTDDDKTPAPDTPPPGREPAKPAPTSNGTKPEAAPETEPAPEPVKTDQDNTPPAPNLDDAGSADLTDPDDQTDDGKAAPAQKTTAPLAAPLHPKTVPAADIADTAASDAPVHDDHKGYYDDRGNPINLADVLADTGSNLKTVTQRVTERFEFPGGLVSHRLLYAKGTQLSAAEANALIEATRR